jgi:RNA polymerase sigma factor (sigma-70 family)
LIAYMRKGNTAAFEVLMARYEPRLLAFCRHLLGSREDAEDVLQEVMAAAFNAILADERPINARPWLYRIARNRSLNHLRKAQAIGVDTMDTHFSDHGASTADKVHEREEFRLLVGDIHELPETQKTALVLREMDALSYEQIAEAMETTVPSVKSLLVRARVSLAEASEARLLSCDEVRGELGEVAEGLKRRPSPLVRRHLRDCTRCTVFRNQLKHTNKALAALMPIGPFVVIKKLAIFHLGHSASAGSSATAAGSGAGAAGAAGAAAGGTALAGAAGGSGFISAGLGALATKAAAGLAAAALVGVGAVEADHSGPAHHPQPSSVAEVTPAQSPAAHASVAPVDRRTEPRSTVRTRPAAHPARSQHARGKLALHPGAKHSATTPSPTTTSPHPASTTTPGTTSTPQPGRTSTQTDPTVLEPPSGGGSGTVGTTTGPVGPEPTGTTGTGSGGTPTTGGAPITQPTGTQPTGTQPTGTIQGSITTSQTTITVTSPAAPSFVRGAPVAGR